MWSFVTGFFHQHDLFKVYLCCSMDQFLFYYQVIFYCLDIPHQLMDIWVVSLYFILFYFGRGERQRERERILSRFNAQCGAWHKAPSHMTLISGPEPKSIVWHLINGTTQAPLVLFVIAKLEIAQYVWTDKQILIYAYSGILQQRKTMNY